jgi:hypothetical protein
MPAAAFITPDAKPKPAMTPGPSTTRVVRRSASEVVSAATSSRPIPISSACSGSR